MDRLVRLAEPVLGAAERCTRRAFVGRAVTPFSTPSAARH